MLRAQQQSLLARLMQIDASLRKNPSNRPEAIERRIVRWLGRSTTAEKIFSVTVVLDQGCAVGLEKSQDHSKLDWSAAAQGLTCFAPIAVKRKKNSGTGTCNSLRSSTP